LSWRPLRSVRVKFVKRPVRVGVLGDLGLGRCCAGPSPWPRNGREARAHSPERPGRATGREASSVKAGEKSGPMGDTIAEKQFTPNSIGRNAIGLAVAFLLPFIAWMRRFGEAFQAHRLA